MFQATSCLSAKRAVTNLADSPVNSGNESVRNTVREWSSDPRASVIGEVRESRIVQRRRAAIIKQGVKKLERSWERMKALDDSRGVTIG
jgi:hypothetical protein